MTSCPLQPLLLSPFIVVKRSIPSGLFELILFPFKAEYLESLEFPPIHFISKYNVHVKSLSRPC